MNALSPLPACTTTGLGAPDTRGPVHDINLDDPWIRQVLLACLQDLAGCPTPALPELTFRLLKQRLLTGSCTTITDAACTGIPCTGRHLTSLREVEP